MRGRLLFLLSLDHLFLTRRSRPLVSHKLSPSAGASVSHHCFAIFALRRYKSHCGTQISILRCQRNKEAKMMKATSAQLFLLLIINITASAMAQNSNQTPSQQASQPAPIPLWANGAPGAKGDAPEDIPSVQLYQPPDGKATGAAIVVCPGGGYAHLAPHEGHDVAVWLNTIGVTAVVLKYRLGPKYQHPAMMQDALRAIRYTRSKAAEWKIDPNRVGVMGFSAG